MRKALLSLCITLCIPLVILGVCSGFVGFNSDVGGEDRWLFGLSGLLIAFVPLIGIWIAIRVGFNEPKKRN